ncbi:hypothetical protein [Brevundimonas sp. SL130]|uniref:hypothetical protein n=1 Tax=Brevundimonas sp. SL130 TaxID=2995143 RepID=UPI00226CA046|nr:hypothetical protein [Brevundimonas sp. SL130]WAC59786.1 hypothetical protein OU998_16515 [Brevundimonas sp. SL130]
MVLSRLLEGRGTGDFIPSWMSFLSVEQLATLLTATGAAMEPKIGRSPDQEYKCLRLGLQIVKDAPDSIDALRNVDQNLPAHPFFGRIRKAAKSHCFDVNRALRRLMGPEPLFYGILHLKSLREKQKQMTATQVAARLKIERSQLRTLIDGGVLGERKGRGVERVHDWFSEDDVARLDTVLRSRVSAWNWGRRVGLSNVDVRQLLAARIIEPYVAASAPDLFPGLQLSAASLAGLERMVQLACVGAGSGDKWLPVVQVFRRLGGGYKPWAGFLSAVADGRFKHALGRGGSDVLHFQRLCIHPDDALALTGRLCQERGLQVWGAEDFGAYRPIILSWGETESLLNCFPADIARLLEAGYLQRRQDDNQSGIDAESAERFCKEYISVSELAAITGRNPNATASRLSKAGWHRHESGFWPREALSEMVTALQPRAIASFEDGCFGRAAARAPAGEAPWR